MSIRVSKIKVMVGRHAVDPTRHPLQPSSLPQALAHRSPPGALHLAHRHVAPYPASRPLQGVGSPVPRYPSWRPGFSGAADLRSADLRMLSTEALRDEQKKYWQMLTARGCSYQVTAFLVSTSLSFGLAREYEACSDGGLEAVGVFQVMEVALIGSGSIE
jgi:hypothetical protein